MNISFNKKDGELTVAIDGRLDTVTAPELDSFLASNYDGTKALIFDCEKLVYVSSAGLRVLLTAHKRIKGAMKLINGIKFFFKSFDFLITCNADISS